MQSAPPFSACGTSWRLAVEPTEKKHTSKPASVSGVASSTRRPRTSFPADRADASSETSWKPRSSRRSIMTPPTAPVAPTTATLGMLPLRFGRVELEGGVQRGDRRLDLVAAQVAGDLDRRRRHDLRLDPVIGEGRERLGGDARVALHAGSDHADLAEIVARAPVDAETVEHLRGCVAVLGRRREDDLRARLDDRVDVDARLGERGEQARRSRSLDAVKRLLERVRDSGDQRFLEHAFVLLANPGAVRRRERRADVQLDRVVARDLDRAYLEHLRTARGHLEHLVVAQRVELSRVGTAPGGGGVAPLDGGVDRAGPGAERGGGRARGQTGPAAAEGGDVLIGRNALEPGDEDDAPLVERLVDPARADVDDLRLAVDGVGHDPGLRASE